MEERFDLDDATDGIFYFGESGVTVTVTGSIRGELILETYKGVDSKRLYRFKDGDHEWFLYSHKNIEGIDCPKCGSNIIADEKYTGQDHEDNCSFLFDTKELVALIAEKNKDCNKWWWIDKGYNKLEAALLDLFEDLKITKQPKFKDLKNLIQKTEDKIFKAHDPDYKTEKEMDALYRKYKREQG